MANPPPIPAPVPSLEQVTKGLIAEVLKGRQALAIAVGLTGADQVVLNVAPVFFGMAYDGNIELAQMYAAKLYDKTKNPKSSARHAALWSTRYRCFPARGE